MQAKIDSKVTITLPDGRVLPARVADAPEASPFTMRDGTEITIVRADVISLRTSLAGEEYLAYTNETVNFGFRPVMKPRYSTLVGLDATAEGEVITLQTLIDLQTKSNSEFLAASFAANQTATSAADL